MKQNKTLVVIGGGAAGFFCAVNAARLYPSLKVILTEKSSKLLSKVKISGGGRCNVTHACFNITELSKKYPRGSSFLKHAFHDFYTKDTIQWFEERGVRLKTEADGRMFPETNDSQTIIDCLLNEAGKYGVDIFMNADVTGLIHDQKQSSPFIVALRNGRNIQADFVCIASGGFSQQSQFDWIVKHGHTIEKPVPSLFTFNIPDSKIRTLMGIAVEDAAVKIAGTNLKEQGPVLITHWGLSGPAVLRLSSWGARVLSEQQYDFKISVNWLPQYNETSVKEFLLQIRFENASSKIVNRNPFALPGRLWEYFLQECGIDATIRWADLPAKEQNKLAKILCGQEFHVKGKTTFKEEFVTAGGITLSEIDHHNMQSKIMPGLFFAGEIINVDGITGGFNFQNAWTTGWIAAKGVGLALQ